MRAHCHVITPLRFIDIYTPHTHCSGDAGFQAPPEVGLLPEAQLHTATITVTSEWGTYSTSSKIYGLVIISTSRQVRVSA